MYNMEIIIADNLGGPPVIKMKCIFVLCMFSCFSIFGLRLPGVLLCCLFGLVLVLRGVVLPCRILVVVLPVTFERPCSAEFWVPFVIEQGYVAEDLELLHHVAPVSVEFVDVLDQLGDVVGHGCQFRTGELVVHVHRDAGYHSESSRSVCCWSARLSASSSQRSRAAAALS